MQYKGNLANLASITLLVLILFTSCAAQKRHRQAAQATDLSEEVLQEARKYLGRPYQYGGTGQKGFDCSGLVCTVFQKVNIQLPRSAEEQARLGQAIGLNEVQPGDLVFFKPGKNSRRITHVGIVSKVESKDKVWFIHSATSRGVIESSLTEGYWKELLVEVRRLW